MWLRLEDTFMKVRFVGAIGVQGIGGARTRKISRLRSIRRAEREKMRRIRLKAMTMQLRQTWMMRMRSKSKAMSSSQRKREINTGTTRVWTLVQSPRKTLRRSRRMPQVRGNNDEGTNRYGDEKNGEDGDTEEKCTHET
jgi:hypothetical protein